MPQIPRGCGESFASANEPARSVPDLLRVPPLRRGRQGRVPSRYPTGSNPTGFLGALTLASPRDGLDSKRSIPGERMPKNGES